MRSGNVHIDTGYIGLAGYNGGYWSTMASPERHDGTITPSAYDLGFNSAFAYSSADPNYRWLGFPPPLPK